MISEAGVFKGKLLAHARTPLYGNGYALVMSSGISSALGLLYWALAARLYSAEAVGFNAATISAMMFLAGFAQLNLMSALLRFLPEAGRQAGRFILVTYAVSMAVAAVASVVFGQSIGHFVPTLTAIGASPALLIWFAAATIGWCVFVLEDSAITGLRRATWVPISNTGFSIGKIVLLIVLAATFPSYGVFASWTIALAAAVVLTNLLLFARLLPRQAAEATAQTSQLSIRTISRFVFTDYLGSLCWLACTTLLPIVVASQAGIRATAYFYLAWQIGYGLHMVSINMGYSLVVEGSTDPKRLAIFSKRLVLLNMRIVAPAAVAVAIGAPYIMGLFGADYAAEGSNLLRLLAVAAVPYGVVSVYISVVRVQRRVRRAAIVLAVMCGLVLTLSAVFLRWFGLEGVGIAWLLTQTALGGFLLLFQLRPMWRDASTSEAMELGRAPRVVGVRYGD
jgi:O-antigen/teichoic acid export membrane protein